MTQKEVHKQLEEFGTAQNRKVYKRHGVTENLFGVSYANLGKLTKKIKIDHKLAQELWDTRNHDARILATMIADPSQVTDQLLETWVKDLTNYVLTDAFSGLVSKTRFAQKKMEKWTKAKEEWVGRAGWLLLSHLAMKNESLSDDYFENHLEIIERDIHLRKNRIRDAMNSALMSIGIYRKNLQKRALSAARKIGKVEVDHGKTNCTTPEAESYIRKALERKTKRPQEAK